MLTTPLNKLPHREPFRFVSSIESLEAGRRGVGVWQVDGEEDFFAGHFPGNPIVPGVLLAEALAQLSGLVAFSVLDRVDACGARLAQVNVKFHSGVVPPAEVRLESELLREMSGLYLFETSAKVDGVVAASGSIVLARATAEGTRL